MSTIVDPVRTAPPVTIVSPFPLWAVPRVWLWCEEFRSRVADDFAPRTLDDFVADWERRVAPGRSWAVYRDGEIGGLLTFEQWSPMAGQVHAVFKRSFWGRATTLVALRQVLTEIFSTGVTKIAFQCFRDNASVIGLARKVGAEKEGLLRQQTVRGGQLVDIVSMGLTKEDFEHGLPIRWIQQSEKQVDQPAVGDTVGDTDAEPERAAERRPDERLESDSESPEQSDQESGSTQAAGG